MAAALSLGGEFWIATLLVMLLDPEGTAAGLLAVWLRFPRALVFGGEGIC